jgi:peptide/nickel transport system permease protein
MRDLRRFLSHWQNLVGLGIVLFFFGVALAAPVLAPLPEDWEATRIFILPGVKSFLPIPPGEQAILGTVALGIQGRQLDVYYTLVWGARSALVFGVVAAFSTALIGITVGAMSAFLGGWGNTVIMRITDAFLAFPVIAAVILFVQMTNLATEMSFLYASSSGSRSTIGLDLLLETINPVLLALVLFSWMPYARMTHGMVSRIKEVEFVQAARALGAGSGRLVFRHLIPNSIAPAIVMATVQVGGMVLLQAALEFIGLDAGSEWGAMLAVGRRWMLGLQGNPLIYWWVFLPITLALVSFGIGWSLLGDGLNDWLNPRLKQSL